MPLVSALFLLAACKPTITCGPGTHLHGDMCVADRDTDGGDTDVTDTDTDATDTDTDDTSGDDTDTGDSDTDTDGGDTGVTGTDADGDGYATPADCDDASADVHPGAAEVCGDGVDDDCDGTAGACSWHGAAPLDTLGFTLTGAATYDETALHVAGLGDVTGDGVPDVAIPADGADFAGDASGAVYIVAGPITGDMRLVTSSAARLEGALGEGLGSDALPLGDVNGDGNADFYVAGYDNHAGSGYLVEGPVPAGRSTISSIAATAWKGTTTDDQGSKAAAVSQDVDGDGLSDVLTLSASGKWSYSGGGTVSLLRPGVSAAGTFESTAQWVAYNGSNDYLTSVGGLGDIDGDGLGDVAIAGYGTNHVSYVSVFHGPLSGVASVHVPDGMLSEATTMAFLGQKDHTLTGLGDFDGDGADDVAFTALQDSHGATQSGSVYLFSGDITGSMTTTAAFARIDGNIAEEMFGRDTAAIGDVDGDGLPDLAIGAIDASDYGASTGAVYLYHGGVSGTLGVKDAAATLDGPTAGSYASAVAAVGDVDGDGIGDLVVGGSYGDGDKTQSGLAWFLPGGFDL